MPELFQNHHILGSKKEVTGFHIETNLKTMGIAKEDFLDWVEKNC